MKAQLVKTEMVATTNIDIVTLPPKGPVRRHRLAHAGRCDPNAGRIFPQIELIVGTEESV
jgi:hypothetical protein